MNNNEQTVREFWKIFDSRKFAEVKPLLIDDFVCVWPQSNEVIKGADNLIALNKNYPGEWKIDCKRVISSENNAVSEIELMCDGKKVYATSFFEIKDGKISKMTEYWSDPYDAPKWREKWVEKNI